jgi:hypothetical protein
MQADDQTVTTDRAAALKATFATIVGAAHVSDDEAQRRLFSEDVWEASAHVTMLIVAPGSTQELSAVIAAAHQAGVALAPRGAGMSYTSGYLPATDSTVTLDMTRMNRVLNISPQDMTVTVEAGCTWLALNEALGADVGHLFDHRRRLVQPERHARRGASWHVERKRDRAERRAGRRAAAADRRAWPRWQYAFLSPLRAGSGWIILWRWRDVGDQGGSDYAADAHARA